MLAYVTTATFYSITEAGFRVLTPSWIFLLLAVVGSSGVSAGLFGGRSAQDLASRAAAYRKSGSCPPVNKSSRRGRRSSLASAAGLDLKLTHDRNVDVASRSTIHDVAQSFAMHRTRG